MSEYREHGTDSRECWCHPTIYAVCMECDGKGGCWQCDPDHPGLLLATEGDDGPFVIVHKNPEEDERERLAALKKFLAEW